MTWDEMSPRERDALVAEKVMGTSVVWVKALHAYTPREGSTALNDMVPEYVSIPCEDMGDGAVLYWTAECGTPNEYVPREIPRYTTSISAAWEVVEEMDRDRWLGITRHKDFWRAVLSSTTRSAPLHPSAEAPTAPEAICLAALRAKGVEV